MAKINITKKVSARTLVGNVKSYIKDLQNGQDMDIMRVVGLANGLKQGETNFGEWTALIGSFVAEPLVGEKAGKRVRTGQIFLPDVALNLVVGAVENLAKGESVELAFTIGVERDDDIMIGYVYTASFLVEPEINDPLEMLMQKALPAPKAEDKPADKAKEPAPAK